MRGGYPSLPLNLDEAWPVCQAGSRLLSPFPALAGAAIKEVS
ncbi:hypothetical protein RR42_s1215 [Cupriavidus basilensis]|uniref:Uncharacterized protein n=1 Tax=Cupriavidus basilensis TaxID=68895 RepID=A0A0C4YIF9_9BURK|nr:hypothetical protein RR42_s1215 [Cupriavidus basilensis]